MDAANGRFSVIIYTEDQIGLLVQISNIFTRRSLSIWSMYAAPSSIEGIHTITIIADGPESKIRQAKMQLEKRIEVIKVYIDMGNVIAQWPGSPSATEARNVEVLNYIKERNNNNI
ncbi:MAG TPA: hypothetical protein DDY68_05105 [Porphyromonadaceae bacterium]|nr:hypothetical protein [Porphyromonadaceae bacterium]